MRVFQEVRCSNDLDALDITLIDNPSGPGVLVSSLGPASILSNSVVVGDVLIGVNGTSVTSHQQAMETMRAVSCRDFAFEFLGRPLKVCT